MNITRDMISTTAQSPLSEIASNASSVRSPKRPCHDRSSLGSLEVPVMARSLVIDNQAPRACEKCRASKRKCDKKLPYCDRCKRLNAKCHYTQDPIIGGGNGHGVQVICYQPHSLTNDGLLQGPEPLNGISASEILALIPSSTMPEEPHVDWRSAIDTYFVCVHPWYAIIHPLLFEQHIASLRAMANSPASSESHASIANDHFENQSPIHTSISSYQATADPISKELSLLIVAMHLVTRMRLTEAGERSMFDETYRAVKRMLSLLLVGCFGEPQPSIELVQCAALIALYEYGHGDHVTAYRTLGHAVVMARDLDIKPGRTSDTAMKDNILVCDPEEEQNGSLWWGMFVLEQFIHQEEGGRSLQFLLESPSQNTLLPETPPMSPALSSTGSYGSSGPTMTTMIMPGPETLRHLSTSVLVWEDKFGQFQMSAKASYLFHRALQIDKERDSRPDKMPLVASYRDLDVEIRKATLTMIEDTLHWEMALDCFAMLIGSLFVLYLPYLAIVETTPPSTWSDEVKTALAALRFAAKMSCEVSCKVVTSYRASDRSPRVLCAPAGATCYHVIIVYTIFCRIFPEEREARKADIAQKFESLRLFSSRWGIAQKMMVRLEKMLGIDRDDYLKGLPKLRLEPKIPATEIA
ncbi:hypothetical protein F4779DRAFT_41106 [Xylariaceae sp. FL0662B]|nr:hypothetical protein F4779DRAFT_41106 [Xylariaceae sp. FL0662B]